MSVKVSSDHCGMSSDWNGEYLNWNDHLFCRITLRLLNAGASSETGTIGSAGKSTSDLGNNREAELDLPMLVEPITMNYLKRNLSSGWKGGSAYSPRKNTPTGLDDIILCGLNTEFRIIPWITSVRRRGCVSSSCVTHDLSDSWCDF